MTRVLVINSKDMWSGGVVSILSRETDFEIINKNISVHSAIASVLEELRPDAVFVNESMFFASPSAILRWHKSLPGLRVIVLDENENLVHVYEKKEIPLERSLDLVDIVRNNRIISR